MNQFLAASISVERDLAEVAEQLRRSTVEVRGEGLGRGSGVIWRPDGMIVTNAHVATSPRHTVQLADGRAFPARLVRRDSRRDLAILQIDASALPSVQSRDASSLRTGELVLAVGNPIDGTGAFTVGVVSANPKPTDVLVRSDIRLAPGNSGGPLADAQGRVVGINSMVVAGFGVAVTSSAVNRFITSAPQRSIGVTVQPVGLRERNVALLGLLVVELEAGGAAHLSGVLVGDVILRVNGDALNSPEQLSDAVQSAAHSISLELFREGRIESCEVRLVQKSAREVA